jgi:Zn-dependent M28 family amino/carboxypeptidase
MKEDSESGGVFLISQSIANNIFNSSMEQLKKAAEDNTAGKKGSLKKIKSGKINYLITRNSETITTENVLGLLEGTDKKDEILVISAHYDHIGRRGDDINNGADDDGSGTVSVMEIAQAFAEAKKAGNGPRRSILFITVTGEEKGLLGSQYYVEHPIFPLENTVADLNIDMVGRFDPQHKDNQEFVYLVGSDKLSTELHELSEKANDTFTDLTLDYTYNDEKHPDRIYYRSDHWNFAKNGIPIIFYFDGIHEDYHKPTDTIDKIEFDLLQKRASLVYYTAWVLANRDERLVVDKLKETTLDGRN